MGQHIEIMGFLGTIDGKMKNGEVLVSFTSDSTHETLSLTFNYEWQITTTFQEVSQVIKKVRDSLPVKGNSRHDYIEEEALCAGLYTGGEDNLKKGEVYIAFRSNGTEELLCLAFEDKGEICVPYMPVEKLINETRQKK